jgi:hypothetical protein
MFRDTTTFKNINKFLSHNIYFLIFDFPFLRFILSDFILVTYFDSISPLTLVVSILSQTSKVTLVIFQ